MYIEHLKLFNYRIFKHQITVEDFCPGINIFIGPNGSGKSSFLHAFQFLMCGKFLEIKKEISKKKTEPETIKSTDYLLIQLSFNNSRRLFKIKEKIIIFRRLINQRTDKIWISGYSFDVKKMNEFFISNGMNLENFSLFLRQKDHLEFKITGSSSCFEFFKKNSNFVNFYKYQTKIVLLIKKAIMIKEKLSKILKLLLNEQKSKFFEKEPSFKKRKISFLFFILENFFSNIETTFLSSFKNNLIFQFKKLELKTIYLRNKTTLINENLFQIKSKYSSRFNFIKKRKIFIDPTNAFLNLNFRKKQFFIALEKYLSISELFFSKALWSKGVLDNLNEIFYKNTYFFKKMPKLTQILNKNGDWSHFSYFKFRIKDIEKQQGWTVYFQKKFLNYISKNNPDSFLNSNFDFSRGIFLVKQKLLRLLDQLTYEIKFIEKIIINQEVNLCKFFGSNISKSIKIISEITRNKNIFMGKIEGILLDLIAVYKIFEKPAETILYRFLSSIIVAHKNTIPLIITKFRKQKSFILDIIVNKENQKTNFLNLKNSKLINFNSILFSQQKYSSTFYSLIGNIFLCTDLYLANKLSKHYQITTVTLEGQIFYPNGIISDNTLHPKISFLRESVVLKKERNFLYWMLWFIDNVRTLDINFNINYKRQRTFDLINFEINQFLLFQKKKNLNFTKENFSKISSKISIKTTTIYFTRNLDSFEKKVVRSKKKFKKTFKYSFDFQKEKITVIKQIEIQKFFKKELYLFCLKNDLTCYFKKSKNYNIPLKSFKVKNKSKRLLTKKKINKNTVFLKISKQIYSIDYILYINFFSIYNYLKLFIELLGREGKFIIMPKRDKNFFSRLKIKFSFFCKIKKKFKKCFYQKSSPRSTKFFFYIYKLLNFYENLENNFKILYQLFDVLVRVKILKLRKMSKIFSHKFQKILNFIIPLGKSTLIWKEKRLQKNFRKDFSTQFNYTGLKVLLKFNLNDSFCLLEDMSKGQICLSILIFCLTLSIISNKTMLFFDEIDVNMDSYCENLASRLIKRFSSRGIQFFIITHKKDTSCSGDKWYGISISKRGSTIENISLNDSKKFLSIIT